MKTELQSLSKGSMSIADYTGKATALALALASAGKKIAVMIL